MGYDLESNTGEWIGFNSPNWSMLRWLAEQYGWKPQGTQPPEEWKEEWRPERQWSGTYTTNNGQLVTASDANLFADALEAAMNDPDFNIIIESMLKRGQQQLKDASTPLVKLNIGVVPPDEYRVFLHEFVAFCRKGEFRIY